MLVLSRKIGETLIIGDNIHVQILDVNRGQIRIGIDAPKEVNIVRSELVHRTSVAQTYESDSPSEPSAQLRPQRSILERRFRKSY